MASEEAVEETENKRRSALTSREENGDSDAEHEQLVNSEAVAAGEDRGEGEFSTTQAGGGRGYVEHAGAVRVNQSEIGNPYVGQEDQDVEIKPAVMGPPAYASPDPNTLTNRLVPITEHPGALRDELDEDYAKDVQEVSSNPLFGGGSGTPDGSDAGEGGNPSVQDSGTAGKAYSDMTKAELLDEASKRDLDVSSSSNKAEIQEALEADDAGETEESS